MTITTSLEYTPLAERTQRVLASELPNMAALVEYGAQFEAVQPRPDNRDGDVEVLDGVEMIHRFVEAPGDSELLRWHVVEAGSCEPVVFLHGLPESWFMWHRQMVALSATHRVIAPDLKGYGQSDKRTGDYRQEGVAEQLLALFDALGLDRFNLVAHDRGSVIADYLGANHPERVLRYVRGERTCITSIQSWRPRSYSSRTPNAPPSSVSPTVSSRPPTRAFRASRLKLTTSSGPSRSSATRRSAGRWHATSTHHRSARNGSIAGRG